MAFFPTASQAKDRAQGNLVIAKEVNALEEAVITAISNSAFTAEVTDDTTMTNSTPTDATSESYYKSWKGTTTNSVFDEQMDEVKNILQTKDTQFPEQKTLPQHKAHTQAQQAKFLNGPSVGPSN